MAEHLIVVQAVEGSSPFIHPRILQTALIWPVLSNYDRFDWGRNLLVKNCGFSNYTAAGVSICASQLSSRQRQLYHFLQMLLRLVQCRGSVRDRAQVRPSAQPLARTGRRYFDSQVSRPNP